MDEFMQAAVQEAKLGFEENGLPIGSVLVLDGKIVGRGRNQRNQKGSVILHAEMDAIENAGILLPEEYKRSVLYTTLSPCQMCSGTIVYLQISKVVIADNTTILGAENFLKSHGVILEYQENEECTELLRKFPLS
ncbi:MAG: nucleoside deaminase [Candidatus Heimdallarchaeota archaeon]|nr:MAG: nucleoside deaminase [Candidatus Heimdallarchaeota archaeon]